MIKNYFKIAWRNLKKNRLYAFVNITGLTVGIVSCLLIGVYIKHELSYDRFNGNADRIARVTMDYNQGGNPQKVAVTGTKVGPQFKRTFPSVADFVRLQKRPGLVAYDNRLFKETGILYADPSFFKIFSFNMISGDVSALNTTDKIIITQTTAKKYFDNNDPIGKVLKLDNQNYMVSGIAADAPSNSQIKFDFIVSFNALSASKKEEWWSANDATYLLLKNNDEVSPLQKQITAYMTAVNKSELKMDGSHYLTYHLEPLTSVHLHSNLSNGLEPNGSITYIYILVVVAVLILMIACVNYVNLSIAQSAGRGAEIGIRKVMGAGKHQLFRQFIGESLFVTAIGIVLAIGLAFVLLPFFNQIAGKQLQSGALFDPVILISLILLGLVIGFSAGAYPALLLSNVKIIKILKSGFLSLPVKVYGGH
jgi:putative ABC transport system permease protein